MSHPEIGWEVSPQCWQETAPGLDPLNSSWRLRGSQRNCLLHRIVEDLGTLSGSPGQRGRPNLPLVREQGGRISAVFHCRNGQQYSYFIFWYYFLLLNACNSNIRINAFSNILGYTPTAIDRINKLFLCIGDIKHAEYWRKKWAEIRWAWSYSFEMSQSARKVCCLSSLHVTTAINEPHKPSTKQTVKKTTII